MTANAGVPWCPDCAQCLEPVRARVAETGGTLLEVQVCTRMTQEGVLYLSFSMLLMGAYIRGVVAMVGDCA